MKESPKYKTKNCKILGFTGQVFLSMNYLPKKLCQRPPSVTNDARQSNRAANATLSNTNGRNRSKLAKKLFQS